MKVSLPEEAVTYDVADLLGIELDLQGKYEEAKVFKLAVLEGRRSVLAEEQKETLGSQNNIGIIFDKLKDYEGALNYYQQARRVQEKVLGKTHSDTFDTIMNMAIVYKDGLKDFTKAEEMYRLSLDGYERSSLGKDHEETKRCARNLARLLCWNLKSKEKTRELAKRNPHLLNDTDFIPDILSGEGE